jgi:UDP-glucose 4-epimerase
VIDFPIQGTGSETRAFCYIDDAIAAIGCVLKRGEHLNIYHIGTDVETTITQLAHEVAGCFGREVCIVPGALQPGSTLRRCPDISKIRTLGFEPHVSLSDGIRKAIDAT